MDRKPEVRELSAGEVEQVTGGLIITALAGHVARTAVKGSTGDTGSGGSDPTAQMFQQILQQLTQRQG